ncbi:MAG: hypothetical protein ACKOW5_02765 [Actinomycetales bacterium]
MFTTRTYAPAAPSISAPQTSLRRRWSRILRRHRRVIAAAATGLGVLFVIAALRPAPPAPPLPPDPRLPPAGQVALPVELASASAATMLQVGDRVDVVSVREADQPARILARDVTVLLPASTAGFVGSASGSVLLAMSESAALQVAQATGQVTVLLRAPGDASS